MTERELVLKLEAIELRGVRAIPSGDRCDIEDDAADEDGDPIPVVVLVIR